MEVGLSPGDFVLDGDPTAPPKKGAEPPPQFSANVYCGQMAGWIKMTLAVQVGLGPGHTSSTPQKIGQSHPIFRPIFILVKRLDASIYATCYGGRPQPR